MNTDERRQPTAIANGGETNAFKIMGIAAVFLLLGACGSVYSSTVVDKAASSADDVLLAAEWTACYGASVGAVKRKYGQSVERAEAYKNYCDGVGEANVVAPRE